MIQYYYEEHFNDFLENYFIRNHSEDLKIILTTPDVGKHYAVVIEAPLLFDGCLELRSLLLCFPTKIFPHFDKMLQKAMVFIYEKCLENEKMSLKSNLHARIEGMIFYPDLNRNVIPRSTDVGLLISISGIIVRTASVQLLQSWQEYTCNSCKHNFKVKTDDEQFDKFKGRIQCPNPEACSSTKFSVKNSDDTDKWRDFQKVKLQERVQGLSIRVIPRTIAVILEDDLVDTCKPGDDVTIVGIMCRRWQFCSDGNRCHVQHQIKANHVQINNQKCLTRITTDMQQYFTDFWLEYKNRPLQGRNEIIQSLCPQIYGLYQIKLAVALVLASGVAKSNDNGTRIRGESHMLLIGDPGTGKSQFLKYATKIIPRSVFTTGVGSTSAGLTVSAIKDGGEWQLEAGALVLADGGLCCIDEFNSIRENDKSSILEAMEQQTISVAKGGLVCKMNSRCIVLAAANPKGNYDENIPTSINIAISTPLLSRFDLIFMMFDTKSEQWDRLVSEYVLLGQHTYADDGSHKLNLDLMQSYFSIIKQLRPTLGNDANLILQRYYLAHRRSDNRNVARTTVRLLESVIRLSEAHAKIMFRSEVLIMDAIFAIIVTEDSLGGLGLLDQENVVHTKFPDNPDELYKIQGEIILKKLDLENIWIKEFTEKTFNDVIDSSPKPFETDCGYSLKVASSTFDNENLNLFGQQEDHQNSEVNEATIGETSEKTSSTEKNLSTAKHAEVKKSALSRKTLKKLTAFSFSERNDSRIQGENTTQILFSSKDQISKKNEENLSFPYKSEIQNPNIASKSIFNSDIEMEDFGSVDEKDLTLDWLKFSM